MKKYGIVLYIIVMSFLICQTPVFSHSAVTPEDIQRNFQTLKNVGLLDKIPLGDTGFDQGITRAQLASVLVKIYNLPMSNETSFTDTQEHWAAAYIAAVKKAGFMIGVSDSQFEPDKFVTYEQFAVVLVRTFNLTIGEQTTTSEKVSIWARKYVALATNEYLLNTSGNLDYTLKADHKTIVSSIFSVYNSYQINADIRKKLNEMQDK